MIQINAWEGMRIFMAGLNFERFATFLLPEIHTPPIIRETHTEQVNLRITVYQFNQGFLPIIIMIVQYYESQKIANHDECVV
ncbi:MAG: hypothetical protein OXH90_10670 [Paracoccaceae bacterium]|nr:hypothetical protein [Paracoccaceae bacterium]MDE2917222.1 hypothetical protein [Paracoccaceae bacterium]